MLWLALTAFFKMMGMASWAKETVMIKCVPVKLQIVPTSEVAIMKVQSLLHCRSALTYLALLVTLLHSQPDGS